MNDVYFDIELDCKGMLCPLPILKTKILIDTMNSGQVLKMLSTDAGSINDVNAWSNQTGHELLASVKADGLFTYFIKKS